MLTMLALGNQLIYLHYYLRLSTALIPYTITSRVIRLALTLISVIYPSHYRWNQPDLSLTSPTIPTTQILASGFTSITKEYQYKATQDYVLITDGENESQVYDNLSHIPPSTPPYPHIDFPYGWSPHKVGVVQKALPQPPTLTGGSNRPQPHNM